MSSTNRGAERRQDDAYYTPGWAVRRLLDVWTPLHGRLVEPACGDGAIICAIGIALDWIGYDIRVVPPSAAIHMQCDFLTEAPDNPSVVAVITNPPYCLAEEFIRKSRELYQNAELVFLLRLAFLASEKRLQLWRDIGTPDVYVLPNRPSFTGGGTDSADYAWFHWPKAWTDKSCGPQCFGNIRVLASTPASERRP
jgi:hypothetical protein